ncbi:hypothetical protein O181_105319 [Austropuccinia psidii MF-1]|uniref:Uncharacterized protein n=1 Tax=Austropuccinia psidii MF-1 TaxID=1389203 RepID=A0A9Q3JP61_9BASI|nr:hypothetical protein [Austropuccinia psidii MF-1]
MPLINELKELWKRYHFSPTSTGPSGSFIRVGILTAIVDVVAMGRITRFLSHSGNQFCNFAPFTKLKLKKLVFNFTTHAHTKIINQPFPNGFGQPHNKDKQFSLCMTLTVQTQIPRPPTALLIKSH